MYHKLELRNGRQRTSRAPSYFCAVSFDGVIISEGRYTFYRCFSLSCKIFLSIIPDKNEAMSCHFDDTESKIRAIAHSCHFVR